MPNEQLNEPSNDKRSPAQIPSGHASSEAPSDVYLMWAEEDRSEGKSLRFSLGAALIVHLLLLLITFPQIYTDELEEPEPKKVLRLAPTPRFRPPPVEPKKKPPKLRARKVPIPDPEPDKIEPFATEEEVFESDLPDIDDLPLGIPDRPPEPDITEPLVVGGEVSAPKRQVYVAPRYPELARKVRRSGPVVLRAVIDREGNISDLKVIKGLPFGLTEAAVEAVQQWKFSAATLRGKPVPVYYELVVNFELR